MRLSDYTDFTLRVLMYCAAHPARLVTIAEMAEAYCVSKNHLMKVVNDLARNGWLETTRGRGGGVRLMQPPEKVLVGDIVRQAETDFRQVECFDKQNDLCPLTPACRLKLVLSKALKAYFAELDAVTLADIAAPPGWGTPRTRPVAGPQPLRAVPRAA